MQQTLFEPHLSDDRDIYTVSDLNRQARTVLEEAFLPVWVSGEVSNFSCPASGHWYFSLKDNKAQVRCAMFRNRNYKLTTMPENGMQVLVKANVSLYEGRGDFQLIIDDLEEAGDGALLRAFETLKKQLHAKGLFDEKHKKPLPAFPACIGVITSATGAALHDVLSVLRRRFASIPVIIYPSQVQGDSASEQLCDAIITANRRQECDVLILTRGGGSMEDLWCFNHENLAHVIFDSTIPIISAVGHEIDFTIADFVADKRAPTPSVAAELASPDRIEWLNYTKQLNLRLCQTMQQLLKHTKQECQHLRQRLRHPSQHIREYTQRIDALSIQLQQAQLHAIQNKQQQLHGLTELLNKVSPLATLARGYALVQDPQSGAVIKHAKKHLIGSTVHARLAKGELVCDVTDVIP